METTIAPNPNELNIPAAMKNEVKISNWSACMSTMVPFGVW